MSAPVVPSWTYYTESSENWKNGLKEAFKDTFFRTSIIKAAKNLKRKGYAVIPEIFSKELCDAVEAEIWRIFNVISGEKLSKPLSEEDLKHFKFTTDWFLNKHGIFEDGRFAHLPVVQFVRTHPYVVFVFACLYGCEDLDKLISSLDRINVQLPPEFLPRGPKFVPPTPTDKDTEDSGVLPKGFWDWLHRDQAGNFKGLRCIQGLVQFTDSRQPGNASLNLVPYSHLLSKEALEKIFGRKMTDNELKKHWIKASDEDKARLAKVLRFLGDPDSDDFKEARTLEELFVTVLAPPGSLLLWDSRILHQGGRILASRDHSRPNPVGRLAFYVCYQPFLGAQWPEKERVKKEKACREKRPTAHWPLKTTIFGQPRTYGREVPIFNFEQVLSDELPAPGSVLDRLYGLSCTRDTKVLGTCPLIPEARLSFHPDSGVRVRSAEAYKDDEDSWRYFEFTEDTEVTGGLKRARSEDEEDKEELKKEEPQEKKARIVITILD